MEKTMQNPKLIPVPFANSGIKDEIPKVKSTSMSDEKASWEVGFPEATMLPVYAGGLPPDGKDFNGVLNQISENIVFQSKGGRYKFDPGFAQSIRGYPKGAILQTNDESAEYQSLIDNNLVNFNTATPQEIAQSWRITGLGDAIEVLNGKFDKASVKNELGLSQTEVVSQKVVTEMGSGVVGSFEDGLNFIEELTSSDQQVTLENEFGKQPYYWDGDLPKQVPAGSTPQSTGGIGKGAWVSVGDASLRSDIGTLVKTYKNVTSMMFDSAVSVGSTVRTLGFYSAGDGGDAVYEITNSITSNEFNLIKLSNGNVAKLINGKGNARRYGAKLDLVNDDGAAINACIADSRTFEASSNDKGALTSVTIKPVSGTRITLPTGFVIKLKDKSNVELFDSSDVTLKKELQITGGTWDMNGKNQVRDNGRGYIGTCIRLADWTDLHLSKMCIKDPVSFGVQLGNINRFTVRDIYLDYDNSRVNMDGIHCNGGCHSGVIDNISGLTNDDFVALNAKDGAMYELRAGPITNIEISNIKSTGDSYRGVRLLSDGELIDNITINGIYGDFRYANVAITKYVTNSGNYGRIVINNMNGNITTSSEAMLSIDSVVIDTITLNTVNRTLSNPQKEVIELRYGGYVKNLTINGINQSGDYATPALVTNRGKIDTLTLNGITNNVTSSYHPILSSAGDSVIGFASISNVNYSHAKNLLLLASASIGNISFDRVLISEMSESPVRINGASKVQKITINNCNFKSSENLVRVAGTSKVTDLTLDNILFDGNSDLRDAVTVIDSGYIQNTSINNSSLKCRDAIHLESNSSELFYVSGSGNDLVGMSRYAIYKASQSLRVNSPQFGIDKSLVTSARNGDIVFNNSTASGSIGLYINQNGTWYK